MANGKLLIGWSRGDITPRKKTLLQGQFHARISSEAISPLTATALALEAYGKDGAADQAVFLSCDLTHDGFKEDLLRELGDRCPDLDRRKLTVNCTHTHTAPSMKRGIYDEPQDDPEFMNPEQYRQELAAQLAEIVTAAWTDRRHGSIARGFGYATVGRCRRAVYADGTARMYGKTDRADFSGFESCEDHAINMLFTQDQAGRLTGMIVNLACSAQCDESMWAISADFWHNVRQAISEHYGAEVHLLPQCAPAGDQSPHLLADRKEEKDLRDRLGVDDKGMIARRIMASVDEGLTTSSPAQDTVELVHEVKTFHLPRLFVTKEQYELEKRIHDMSEAERAKQPFGFDRIWPFGLVCDLIARYEQQEAHPEHEIESHIIRLGDVVFATNPFELFVDYGTRIRCQSRALQTFLVQLADGSGNGFYLPTQRALDGDHYSALIKSNWVGPEGGALLVKKTVHAINTLFAGEEYGQTR